MYVMNFNKYLLDYDKNINQSSEVLVSSEVITDSEVIIDKLLEIAISGVVCVDDINDIDITKDLFKFYSSEWLNLKELNYDNCIWWYVKDTDNKIYKEVYSFSYNEGV